MEDEPDLSEEPMMEETVPIVADIVVPAKKRGRKKKIVVPKIPKKRGRRKIEDKKPSICGLCGRVLCSATKLIIHMRTHTGEKPFACTYCDAKYARKDKLTVHIRSHTGDKPYECSVCQKKFSIRTKLVLHERIHTGEKPFHCEVENCEARFSQRDKLVRHLRVHTKEKPYNCQVCLKDFNRKDKLNEHIKTYHPSEVELIAVVQKIPSASQSKSNVTKTTTSPSKSLPPLKPKSTSPLKSTTKENEQIGGGGAVIRRNPSRLSKVNHKVSKMKSDVDPLEQNDDDDDYVPRGYEEEGSEFDDQESDEESFYLHGDTDFDVDEPPSSSSSRQQTKSNHPTPATLQERKNATVLEKEWRRSQELCKMFHNMRKTISPSSFSLSKGNQFKCHVCKMFFPKEIVLAQHLINCH